MCSCTSWEKRVTLWLMKLFQSLLHYLRQCTVVNLTLSVCLNSWELDISGEKWCSASSSMISFLSLITLVQLVLSGIRQTRLWVSRWLRLMTVRDSSYLEDKFILMSSLFRDGTVVLSSEPSACSCLSVGSSVCLWFPARKCVEIASGCLHRGGCAETHYWDTSWVNISCAWFDLQCCSQDGP